MTLSDGVGILGLLRGILLDRPSVKVLIRTTDHAKPGPNVITTQVGLWTHVEVHNTGRVALRVTAVSLELADHTLLALSSGTRLPETIERPGLVKRSAAVARLRTEAAGRRARRIRVDASPDHAFYAKLPKGWERFPDADPPSEPGSASGAFMAWV